MFLQKKKNIVINPYILIIYGIVKIKLGDTNGIAPIFSYQIYKYIIFLSLFFFF